MADERIDIVVTDKIDPSVDKKLRSIADNADRGSNSVKKLKAELASINTTPVTKLQAATETSTASINKQLTAQNALNKTTVDSSAADLKAATSKAKVSAAIETEIEQQTRLAAVIDRTIARQAAADAANTANASKLGGLSGSKALAARQNAMMGLTAATNEMAAASAVAEAASVSRFGRIKQAVLGAYDALRDGAHTVGGNFKGFFGSGGAATVEKEASAVTKLGHAAGTNSVAIRELFVLGREASRGNFSRMAGSVSILAQALGLLYTVLIPVTIAIGTFLAGMKLFQMSIQTQADPQLKAYANTLGLTSKEMRKLGDETVGAEGKLKSFNTIHLTFGDVFKGFVKTVKDSFDLSEPLAKLKDDVTSAFTSMLKDGARTVAQLYAGFATAYKDIGLVWHNFPAMLGEAFVQGVNNAIAAIENLVNSAIHGINKMASGANSILNKVGIGNVFGTIADVQFGRMENKWKGTSERVKDQIVGDYNTSFNKATDFMQDFHKRWIKNSVQAGKDRLKGLADAIKNNRNPAAAHKTADPKTRQDYLNDTNKKLDDELSRMHLLKDAREEQQRLDEIEEAFAKRRQTLTATEIAGFKAKIHAIQEYKYVQAEMDRIYEEVTGPARTYNAALQAAAELMGKGAITAQRYSQEVLKAGRAYQEATDPLFAMKEAVDVSTKAAGLYGDALERNNYYEQIRQQFLAQGVDLSKNATAAQLAEVDALMKKNDALLQQQYIQNQVGAVVNPILEEAKLLANKANFYAEIDRLRQTDVLNEQQAQRAKYALDAKFSEMRLAGASAFFGELAGLASSGNKKLAAIGKAAAIAQATIDGFVAVQKALASAPPPWNFALAAAVALKTGAQVAGIVSTNVGGFKDGGDFIVQGRAGVDQNNINMDVSRGERITIQTPQQQREAANSGGSANVTVPVKVINVHDKREIIAHLQSDEGERVILNVIKNNPSVVKAANASS